MSEASGTGQAGPATAVTANGAAEPPHIRAAYARQEADAADERVERMRRKLAKAKEGAKAAVDTATEALAEAQTEAKAAHRRADALTEEAG